MESKSHLLHLLKKLMILMPYSTAAVLVRATELPKFRRSELDCVPCILAVDLRALGGDWEGIAQWQWVRPQPQPGPSLP